MLAAISPADINFEESLSTLQVCPNSPRLPRNEPQIAAKKRRTYTCARTVYVEYYTCAHSVYVEYSHVYAGSMRRVLTRVCAQYASRAKRIKTNAIVNEVG